MQDYIDERDGGYHIAGTRIGLSSIVLPAGESPDEILRSFPMAGPLVKKANDPLEKKLREVKEQAAQTRS